MGRARSREDSAVAVTRERVVAFRLARHHLADRLPAGALVEAADACGIQDTPPGSATLALHARVRDLTWDQIERALEVDRTLLQIRSLRTAPYVVPTATAHVFSHGALPDDEASLGAYIRGALPGLGRLGWSATELVARTSSAVLQVLDGRTLPFSALSRNLAEHLAKDLRPAQRAIWDAPSEFRGLPLGQALVHFALYVVGLHGLVCYAPREGREAALVRTDQWLGRPLPAETAEASRAGLVRRYLICYGPSTPGHLAEWMGASLATAARAWGLVEPEIVPVEVEGRRAWLLEGDLPDLLDPPEPRGLRLLPPYDPFLALRDRDIILPDRALQRRVWRLQGNPGVVLASGRPVALWRPTKRGRRLTLRAEPFEALGDEARRAVAEEAQQIARLRGCDEAEVIWAE